MKTMMFDRTTLLVLLASAALLIAVNALPDRSVARADPKGIKYTGTASCTGCHGEDFDKNKPDAKKAKEVDIWNRLDPHSKTFSVQLTGEAAQAMAKKLNIADPTTNENCLSCHALTGPSMQTPHKRVTLQKADTHTDHQTFEGVSCAACHGPSGHDKNTGWLAPHKDPGWTQKQREATGSVALFDKVGLYDTKDLRLRASLCYSCHVINDSALIAAGHPHRPFDANILYTRYKRTSHFPGDKDPLAESKLWAVGQAVTLANLAAETRDALKAKKDAPQLALLKQHLFAHALMVRQIVSADSAALQKIDAQLEIVGEKGPDAWDSALQVLNEVGTQQSEKLNAQKIDRAVAEGFLKGVAAEASQAAAAGLPGANQFIFSLASLWGNLKDAVPANDERFTKIKGLARVLRPLNNDESKYDAAVRAQFLAEAKAVADLFPGGQSLPLKALPKDSSSQPAPAPAVVIAPEPKPDPKPPVTEPVKPEVAPIKEPPPQVVADTPKAAVPEPTRRRVYEDYSKRPPVQPAEYGKQLFCLECGMQWPLSTNYCGRCGRELPKWEEVKP
ncbi:MAG TPA: multiheme c-type cytochrome [Planctomycetota bacterium]|nr:multiheme c-type cytochrome [Planctomycetota bacterium]